ncbi:MAG: hypothetical protein ACI843_000621 [Psychrobacter glaciei]|jgi:hypothetical protein
MGFKVKFLKAITALVMVLGIIVQSVNAVGAPCPMLSKLGSPSTSIDSADMDHSNMDHSGMNHSSTVKTNNDGISNYSETNENCCEEDNCPMNNGASGLLSLQSVVVNTSISYSIKTIEKIKFILPKKTSSLYRPPISA